MVTGKKMGQREADFRERQRRYVSDVTGSEIDKNTRKTSGPPIQGIKIQVLNEYREKGIIAAKKLFKKLNNVEYPDNLFDEWIEEFNFKNVVQEAYRRRGREYAQGIFDEMNKRKFKGKFSRTSFVKWISEVDKARGNNDR